MTLTLRCRRQHPSSRSRWPYRNLHKLMAYKDEYEVARLAVDPEFAQVTEEWGEDAVANSAAPAETRAMA